MKVAICIAEDSACDLKIGQVGNIKKRKLMIHRFEEFPEIIDAIYYEGRRICDVDSFIGQTCFKVVRGVESNGI